MEERTAPPTLAARLARADPAGLLYGAIVTAAVLVTAGSQDASIGRMVATWAFVLGIYWLTHVYVHAAESLFHGDSHHLLHRAGVAARAEVAVLKGGIPAMVVFVIVEAADIDGLDPARTALYFTVVLLGTFGFIGARHAGRTTAVAWVEALGASMLGILMVIAKTLLH